MSYNLKADRTFRINGSISIGGSIASFVQGMEIAMDANVLQRDSIGTGESVFTQNGDVIGTFNFLLKNTTSLYDTNLTPTLDETLSFWMKAIDNFDPAIISFIQTMVAPKGATPKTARILFDGRIMTPVVGMSVDDAIENATVAGEITTFTSAQRAT